MTRAAMAPVARRALASRPLARIERLPHVFSLPGLDFAGGRILKGPWGEVASANITPDPSGISYYDQKLFLQVLRTGHVRTCKLNPIMLSGYYRNMTDEDINAIYAYLSTLPSVSHRVDNTESPTLCKRCGSKHGYGERN